MSDLAVNLEPAYSALLAEDEPRPFEILNLAGPAPLVLVCDHASAYIPRGLANLGLDEAHLARHIAIDIGIAEVTRLLARMLDAPAVLSRFSRLLVDPNRDPEDPTLIPEVSDGVIVPGNRDLSAAAREARMATFYRPYHDIIEAMIDRKTETMLAPEGLAEGSYGPAVVSMHSFTPVMRGNERPWQIGVLWNRDLRMPEPVMAKLRARGIMVGDNQPYSGREGHGHSLHVHADTRGLANVLLEVRQDLIDTHHGAAEWAEILGGVLREVIADPEIYKRKAA